MKKLHLIATAYLFANLLFSSSFISPRAIIHTRPVVSHSNKRCGPYEFKFTNPAGYTVTQVALYSDVTGTSWTFDNPTFPLVVPGAPFEGGDYAARVVVTGNVSGSVRVIDTNTGSVVGCQAFFNHLIPPVSFFAQCSWYEIRVTDIDSCPN